MDGLVEKATELGVAAIQPLLTERSVLRLDGERALRKVAHWQAVAEAACEQCGRARVPAVAPVRALAGWLAALPPLPTAPAGDARWLLSLQPGAMTPGRLFGPHCQLGTLTLLSGPEGGFAPDEDAAARRAGFEPVALGPRVLRADTAPLAVLGWLALQAAD